MPEISVIVPVYNVENYLKECLDSLVNQSFTDIEIICVDDGATDKSPDILKEYADKDERIKIISQKNQGLAASRNNGLKEACGKYIYFLDSDDYIDLKALEKLHNNAVLNKSEIVLFKFQTFDNNRNIHKRGVEFRIDDEFGDIDYNNFTFSYKNAKRHVLNSAFSACLKLYRKDFIDSIEGFDFPVGLNFEDIPTHVKVMLNASRISFVPEFLYYYRSNPDSILNSTANGFDMFEIISLVENYLKGNGYYDELENEFIFFKIAQILVYMISTKSEDYFNKAKEEFQKTQIRDEKTIKKYALDGYNMVLSSDCYIDYIITYFEKNNQNLVNQNKKLDFENKKLKELNNKLSSSNKSDKLHTTFGFLKNLKK